MSLCFKINFVYVKLLYSFLPIAFTFSDMVTIDKTLNWLTFYDYGSVFKVTRHYVSKLTLFTQCCLQFFINSFQHHRYGDLNLVNFSWLWLNFQGHRGLLCFKINFVYEIFPTAFHQWLSNFQILWPWTRSWID